MKTLALGLVLFALLTVGGLEALGWIVGGLLGLAYLASMVAVLVLVAVAALRRREVLLLRAATIVFAFVASVLVRHAIEDSQVEESMVRGDRICAALERYRARVGRYPEGLGALTPADLDELPATAMGVVRTFAFSYGRASGDEFELHFAVPGWYFWLRGRDAPWRRFD